MNFIHIYFISCTITITYSALICYFIFKFGKFMSTFNGGKCCKIVAVNEQIIIESTSKAYSHVTQ